MGGSNPLAPSKIQFDGGDVPHSATLTVLNEVASPAMGIYSVYGLFRENVMTSTPLNSPLRSHGRTTTRLIYAR